MFTQTQANTEYRYVFKLLPSSFSVLMFFITNTWQYTLCSSLGSNFNIRRLSLSSSSSVPQIKVLRGGYNIDLQKVDSSFTKLHKAAYLNNEDRVKKYLGQIGVNSLDNYGRTALHFAAVNGNVRIIRMLMLAGANPDIQDSDGKSPLIKAIECGHNQVVRVLMELGANVDLADYEKGNTALHHCLINANLDCALYIIRNALIIDYNKRNNKQETSLHLAAKIADLYSVIEELIANGIEIEATDELGRTAAQVAKLHNNVDGYELITRYAKANQHQTVAPNGSIGGDDVGSESLQPQQPPPPPPFPSHISSSISSNSSSLSNSRANSHHRLSGSDSFGSTGGHSHNHPFRFSGIFEQTIAEESKQSSSSTVSSPATSKHRRGSIPVVGSNTAVPYQRSYSIQPSTRESFDSAKSVSPEEPIYSNYESIPAAIVPNNQTNGHSHVEDTQRHSNSSQADGEVGDSVGADALSDEMSELEQMLHQDLNTDFELQVKPNAQLYSIQSSGGGVGGTNVDWLELLKKFSPPPSKVGDDDELENITKRQLSQAVSDSKSLSESNSTSYATLAQNGDKVAIPTEEAVSRMDSVGHNDDTIDSVHSQHKHTPPKSPNDSCTSTVASSDNGESLQYQSNLNNHNVVSSDSPTKPKSYAEVVASPSKANIVTVKRNTSKNINQPMSNTVINNNNSLVNVNRRKHFGSPGSHRSHRAANQTVGAGAGRTKVSNNNRALCPSKNGQFLNNGGYYQNLNGDGRGRQYQSERDPYGGHRHYQQQKLHSKSFQQQSQINNANQPAICSSTPVSSPVLSRASPSRQDKSCQVNHSGFTDCGDLRYVNFVQSVGKLLHYEPNLTDSSLEETNHEMSLLKQLSTVLYDSNKYRIELELKQKEVSLLRQTMEKLQQELECQQKRVFQLESNVSPVDVLSGQNEQPAQHQPNNQAELMVDFLKEHYNLKAKHYQTALDEQLSENMELRKQCHLMREQLRMYEQGDQSVMMAQLGDGPHGSCTLAHTTQQLGSLLAKFDQRLANFDEISQQRVRNNEEEMRLRNNFIEQFRDEVCSLKQMISELVSDSVHYRDDVPVNGAGGVHVRRHSEHIDQRTSKQDNKRQQRRLERSNLSRTTRKSFSLHDLVNIELNDSNVEEQNRSEQPPVVAGSDDATNPMERLSNGGEKMNANIHLDYSGSFSYKSKYFQRKINELRKQLGYAH